MYLCLFSITLIFYKDFKKHLIKMTTNQEKNIYIDLTLAHIKEATYIFLLRSIEPSQF